MCVLRIRRKRARAPVSPANQRSEMKPDGPFPRPAYRIVGPVDCLASCLAPFGVRTKNKDEGFLKTYGLRCHASICVRGYVSVGDIERCPIVGMEAASPKQMTQGVNARGRVKRRPNDSWLLSQAELQSERGACNRVLWCVSSGNKASTYPSHRATVVCNR